MPFGLYITFEGYRLELGTFHNPKPGFLIFWARIFLSALSLALFIQTLFYSKEEKNALERASMRSSLRETLTQLSAVGLIEGRKSKGYFVRSVAEDMMGPLKAFIEGEIKNMIDFMEVRKTLDAWCAKEVINKGTEDDFRRIEETLRLGQDARFHIAIAEASHNIILYHLITYMHNLLSSISYIKKRQQSNTVEFALQHRKIFKAMVNRDPEGAEKAISEHIDGFIEEAKKGLIMK